MSWPPTDQILAQLRSATTATAQASALRRLRDDIVGHEQKKEECVRRGAIPLVRRSLQGPWSLKPRASRGPDGKEEEQEPEQKQKQEQVGAGSDPTPGADARLHATIIIGSLAAGGPAFLEPLFQTGTVDALWSSLAPSSTASRLVLETLRTLEAIADALDRVRPGFGRGDRSLAETLCQPRHAATVAEILTQTSSTAIVQQQIGLAARLLVKTGRDDAHRAVAARAGMLDALTARLASVLVATGFVLHRPGDADRRLPKPAPARAELDPILHAITTIVGGSKHRARQLLRNADLVAVLAPSESPLLLPNVDHQSLRVSSGIDYWLPLVPVSAAKSPSRRADAPPPPAPERSSSDVAYPVETADSSSSSSQVADRSSARRLPEVEVKFNALEPSGGGSSISSSGSEDDESPLVAWLIHRVVDDDGTTRLMAAALLAELWRLGLVSKMRERQLALVVVPIMVRMLDDSCSPRTETPGYPASNDPTWFRRRVEHHGPAVLAALVTDSKEMQKSAVEAGAIKKLAQMLKAAYQPVAETESTPSWRWQASSSSSSLSEDANGEMAPACRMGHPGLSRRLSHQLLVRTATLHALAALAPFQDEYRKKIIEQGVTPCLLESLKPYETSVPSSGVPGDATDGRQASTVMGNPSHVMVAACGLVRMLSRSLSILRTSLIDAGIALPLFRLLTIGDTEVQIAATAVVCNLLLEFSPMRPTIMQAGALKVLCDHAHSANPRLRLNAVWALKHLVASAENAVKVSCLQELGLDWLIGMMDGEEETKMTNDDEDTLMEGTEAPVSEADCPPPDSPPMEWDEEGNVDMTTDDYGLKGARVDSGRGRGRAGPSNDGGSTVVHAEAGVVVEDVMTVGDTEGDEEQAVPKKKPVSLSSSSTSSSRPPKPHQADMLAVQEQVLSLIRNIITGPKSDEMVDYLYAYFGQDRLYGILASKLRVRPVHETSLHDEDDDEEGPQSTTQLRSKFTDTFLDSSSSSSSSKERFILSEPEIITGVCFILVHIAASQTRHRQTMMQQTSLLRSLVRFSRHSNGQVRTALAWIVINLTWVDDPSDKPTCRLRAVELKRLGFMDGLEKMVRDPELDVKEQARTALWQLRELLGT